jgi:hypothetical protein
MNIRNILLAAAAMTAIAGAASAQQSANATAPVKIKVLTPIAITAANGAELNFGSVIRSGTAGGSIVIGTDGQRGTVGGSLTAVGASTTAAASFTVAGSASDTINVTSAVTGLPTGVTVTTNHGANSQILDSQGALTVPVGGTLTIANGATPTGAVSGTLTVTVAYP